MRFLCFDKRSNDRSMPTSGEHKIVQSRILAYAQEIRWRFVPHAAAKVRRGFGPDGARPRTAPAQRRSIPATYCTGRWA